MLIDEKTSITTVLLVNSNKRKKWAKTVENFQVLCSICCKESSRRRTWVWCPAEDCSLVEQQRITRHREYDQMTRDHSFLNSPTLIELLVCVTNYTWD